MIDFKRNIYNQPCTVQRLEYDPLRSAYIALVHYQHNGEYRYIIAPHDLRPGDILCSSRDQELPLHHGNSMPLENLPAGSIVHCIEQHPGQGAVYCRSAGTYGTLMNKGMGDGGKFVLIGLSSKEQRLIHQKCLATIGSVSNPLHKIRSLGKAGRNRWLGRRPRTRANARNAVDHPMGGGFNAKGNHPQSRTGVLAKGYKTRNKKKNTNKFIYVPRAKSKAAQQQH
jgi:large subunit ribosomal protein L2